ncbi:MAG: DUF2075 domain-containing protein, partial [Myxococcota bacterium]|nr:DUF2075 domain-containing protein [Myxococcota bacterium]
MSRHERRLDSTAAGRAWYSADRAGFLGEAPGSIVAELASSAASQGWHIETQQHREWKASVSILQSGIHPSVSSRIEIVQSALRESGLAAYTDVILEYDFRRRGLRIDCILLAPGVIAVLEFKRSRLSPADADQVANYCVNLVEFHEETRRLCGEEQSIVVPILVQTEGEPASSVDEDHGFFERPWAAVLRNPIRCGPGGLSRALTEALELRRGQAAPSRDAWLASRFSPSSSILDAAISLFGAHDVSAIHEHAGSIEQIEATIAEVASQIDLAQEQKRNSIVFVSGAPGAGKTLVGLQLAFDERYREDAVFVTGNAPLVDVLTEALKRSYKRTTARTGGVLSGYPRENARLVIENAT